MSKGLLIVDMPEACNKCEFYQLAMFVGGRLHGTCARTREYVSPEEVTIKRSDRCPLKPIPEKANFIGTDGKTYDALVTYCYNSCIDEILGETE